MPQHRTPEEIFAEAIRGTEERRPLLPTLTPDEIFSEAIRGGAVSQQEDRLTPDEIFAAAVGNQGVFTSRSSVDRLLRRLPPYTGVDGNGRSVIAA